MAFLKARIVGLIGHLKACAVARTPFSSQVLPSPPLLATPGSIIQTQTNSCSSPCSHAALPAHTVIISPFTDLQPRLISPAYMEILPARCVHGDPCQLGKCGFLYRVSCCYPRSSSTVASQDDEIPSENLCISQASRTETSEWQRVDESSSNKTSTKCTESGNKQVAHEEALQAFEALLDRMEASAGTSDHDIGATCLRLAQLCDSAGVDPSRILSYGQRALRAFGPSKEAWEHVACLHVIGHAYFSMGEFEEAVAHLEKSALVLKRLKATVNERDINTIKHQAQTLLGQAKLSLGKPNEAHLHFQQSIKLAEKLLEPGNPDLGVLYLHTAQAHKEAKDLKEAICFCVKALENHANYYGPRSSQAADIRRLMTVVHFDLREYEKVMSEYDTVKPILESLGKFEAVASLDLVAVETLFQLDKLDEAVSKLKGVITNTESTSPSHANALILLAKAYSMLEDDESASKYCERALYVLENQKPSLDTGASFVSLALVYQRQQEIESATSTYTKALDTFSQFSGHQANAAIADIEGQIGFLLLHVEKIDEASPYLERSVSKKSSIHGAESEELLDVHNHLAVVYSQQGKLDEALEQLEAAKVIISKNVIEVDSLTISIYSNLANMYSVFGRFDEAIGCQASVIDFIKRNPDEETMVSLHEAQQILKDLQREVEARKASTGKG